MRLATCQPSPGPPLPSCPPPAIPNSPFYRPPASSPSGPCWPLSPLSPSTLRALSEWGGGASSLCSFRHLGWTPPWLCEAGPPPAGEGSALSKTAAVEAGKSQNWAQAAPPRHRGSEGQGS